MAEKCILVVEDHKPLLTAIQEVLEVEGYSVLTAGNGVRALAVMENNTPDIIIADIMMPQMDGYTLYDRVRSHPDWVPIPFIFLTAKAERDDILRGKDLGVEDYITKPFDPEELVIAVRSRLRRSRSIQRASAAKFDQLKTQIVTVLGHELRTPLTYVSGYTNLALEDPESLSPDELQEFLGGIKRGADRLTRLVEDLMYLVRIDTGRAAEEFKLLARVGPDLNRILDLVIQQNTEKAVARGVLLDSDIEAGLPPLLRCEPFLVEAFGRLVDNAIKFCSRQSGRVLVSARAEDEWVKISVVDNGVGIRDEDLPSLFDRFHQIDRDKMEQQGTGVGLAIAQELIQLHRGDIAVESTLGGGSTFAVSLPLASEG